MKLTKRVTPTSLYPLQCFVCGGDMPSHVHYAPGTTLYFRRNLQTNRDARVCSEKCAKDYPGRVYNPDIKPFLPEGETK